MKRIIILIYIGAVFAAFGSTNTNFLARSTSALMCDSNGVIVKPTNWRSTNDIASSTNLSHLYTIYDASSNDFSGRIESLEGSSGTVNQAYSLQGTGAVVWVSTQTWDFLTASNGTDWTYTYGATWITNEGAKLYGPTFGVASTAQRIVYANIQSSYIYRLTWTGYLNTNDAGPSSVRLYPGGTYYGASHDITTNTAVFTNTADIELVIGAYYYPYYISAITLEQASPDYVSAMHGSIIPDYSNRWDLGDADYPVRAVYAIDYPLFYQVVTNVDVTLFTPRRIGDQLLDSGSNVTYISYGLTTNDWQ